LGRQQIKTLIFCRKSARFILEKNRKTYLLFGFKTTAMFNKSTPYILLNLLSLAMVLVMNYLANALPIAGRRTGEMSDLFPNMFTPAGFTFSIWGVIYLLLLGFAIYQIRFWGRPAPGFLQKIGWLFGLSCLANAGWLLAFHHLQIGLSMLVMLVMLGSLIGIYLRLDIGKAATSPGERWLVHLPFSVYLGWITVATIANAAILLTHIGWDGEPGGASFWTILTLAAAVGLGLAAIFKRRDFAYALVIAWALFGIFSKRIADLLTPDGQVETVALAGIALIGLGIMYKLIKRN
jgi:TspO/MBR family